MPTTYLRPYQSDPTIPLRAIGNPMARALGLGRAGPQQDIMSLLDQQKFAQSQQLHPLKVAQEEEATFQAGLASQIKMLEWQREMMGMVGRIVQGLEPTGRNFPQVKAAVARLMPEAAEQLGDSYDPARVDALIKRTMTAPQFYETLQKGAESAFNGDKLYGVAQILAAANSGDPEVDESLWQIALKLGEGLRLDPSLLSQFRERNQRSLAIANRWVEAGLKATSKESEIKPLSLADLAERYAEKIGKASAAELTYDEAMEVVRQEAATRPIAPVSMQAIPTPAGIYAFDPRAGAVRPAAGGEGVVPQAQAPKPTGGSAAGKRLESDVATINVLIDLAQGIKSAGERNSWPGVGGMGYGWAAEQVSRQTGLGSDKGRELRGKLANLFAEIAKLRGGTALTPTEWSLLDSYVPNFKESVPNIKQKLDNIVWFLDMKKQNLAARYPELLEEGSKPPAERLGGTPTQGRPAYGKSKFKVVEVK